MRGHDFSCDVFERRRSPPFPPSLFSSNLVALNAEKGGKLNSCSQAIGVLSFFVASGSTKPNTSFSCAFSIPLSFSFFEFALFHSCFSFRISRPFAFCHERA